MRYVRRGYNYITKATDVMPYINRRAKERAGWLTRRAWRFLDAETDGSPLAPGVYCDVLRGRWRCRGGGSKTARLRGVANRARRLLAVVVKVVKPRPIGHASTVPSQPALRAESRGNGFGRGS